MMVGNVGFDTLIVPSSSAARKSNKSRTAASRSPTFGLYETVASIINFAFRIFSSFWLYIKNKLKSIYQNTTYQKRVNICLHLGKHANNKRVEFGVIAPLKLFHLAPVGD